MARAIAQGAVAVSLVNPGKAGVTFALAGRSDEAELRKLLRENPMPGWLSLSYEREPDYFLADSVQGERHDTAVARETAGGRLVGMFSRASYDAHINGRVARLGYLGQLRVAADYRGKIRYLRAGYAACRELLHDARETQFYLTSILADNLPARRVLTAGLEGLPTYREIEPFLTFVIPARAIRLPRRAPDIKVEAGSERTLADVADCLQRNYVRYQFAPHWTEALLRSSRCRGLEASDFLLARNRGRVVGCVALWDQRGFKQHVVRGIDPRLARWRRALNGLGCFLGFPSLPALGEKLRAAYLSHVAVDGDDTQVLVALIEAAKAEAMRRGFAVLMIGLVERHPMLATVRKRFRNLCYQSMLYLVHWEDGARAAQMLDGRIAHVEAAML